MNTQPFLFAGPSIGGNGGDGFNDAADAGKVITGIQSITVGADVYVDSLQVTYYLAGGGTWASPKHGGDGGNETKINFGIGETIYQVSGNAGAYVDCIMFRTVLPDGSLKTYGPYGGNGGDPFVMYGAITAFMGRSAAYLDAVGVYNIVYPVSQ